MDESSRLKNKAVANFLWRFAERFGVQGAAFVVAIVLARILGPETFGVIALVAVFTTILNVFVDSGMGTALIQKKDADDLDFSTLFYFNIVACFVLYLLLYFAAPWIAAFYDRPILIPVVRVLGLTLIISGIRNIQTSYVSRNLIFKKFFCATLGGTVVSAAVGIGMAYGGCGIWALVGQQLANVLTGTVVLWLTVKWRPKRLFSFERLKGLFSFGWKLLVSTLIDTIYTDIRQLIIGKMYTATDLAYYNRGCQLPQLVVHNINSSIDSVLLPTMAKVQDSPERVKSMTRRAIRMSSYLIAPLMTGFAACAEPVVRLLLTDKWLECVSFLRIFCVTFMFYPIHTANLNAIKAMGRSDWFLKLEIVKKIMGLIVLFATMWFGVLIMAYSLLLTALLSTIINSYPNAKLLKYNWFEQMKDILPYVGLAAAMGVPVFFVGFLSIPTIITLALQIVVGAAFYVGASAALKLEIFGYLVETLKGLAKKGKAA